MSENQPFDKQALQKQRMQVRKEIHGMNHSQLHNAFNDLLTHEATQQVQTHPDFNVFDARTTAILTLPKMIEDYVDKGVAVPIVAHNNDLEEVELMGAVFIASDNKSKTLSHVAVFKNNRILVTEPKNSKTIVTYLHAMSRTTGPIIIPTEESVFDEQGKIHEEYIDYLKDGLEEEYGVVFTTDSKHTEDDDLLAKMDFTIELINRQLNAERKVA